MTTNRKPDWAKIEAEYVYGGPDVTYRSLAKKHGVTAKAVGERGKGGGWVAKRETAGGRKVDAIKKGAEAEALTTAEEHGAEIVRKGRALAQEFYEVACLAITAAKTEQSARDQQARVIAACAATDKWRLVTEQTTHISETRDDDQRTDEEILEDLEDYTAILRHRVARKPREEPGGAKRAVREAALAA